jgi:hypothetical protein
MDAEMEPPFRDMLEQGQQNNERGKDTARPRLECHGFPKPDFPARLLYGLQYRPWRGPNRRPG